MYWLSVDPATKTGVARWDGSRLMGSGTLRVVKTAKEAKALRVPKGWLLWEPERAGAPLLAGVVAATTREAWAALLIGAEHVAIEEAMGFSAKAVAQLAWRRGYIAALCEERGIPVTEVNTSSWRKAAGEAWGVTFPAKSDAAKALAIDLVREHYGITCTDDEADAVLVGHWALRTRTVKP